MFLLFQANPATKENEIPPEKGQTAQGRPNATEWTRGFKSGLFIDWIPFISPAGVSG